MKLNVSILIYGHKVPIKRHIRIYVLKNKTVIILFNFIHEKIMPVLLITSSDDLDLCKTYNFLSEAYVSFIYFHVLHELQDKILDSFFI